MTLGDWRLTFLRFPQIRRIKRIFFSRESWMFFIRESNKTSNSSWLFFKLSYRHFTRHKGYFITSHITSLLLSPSHTSLTPAIVTMYNPWYIRLCHISLTSETCALRLEDPYVFTCYILFLVQVVSSSNNSLNLQFDLDIFFTVI